MCCGGDRDELSRRVDAACLAQRVDPGKPFLEAHPEPSRVEVDLPTARLLAKDRARHDVARRELGEAMPVAHESLAIGVQQLGAFAAHRLGDEREGILGGVERGGVELHEFHVRELHACAVGNGVAVAGRDNGVRRVSIDLATATSREHGGVGNDLHRPAGDAGAHAAASSAVDDEIQHTRLLEDRDTLAFLNARTQGASNFGSGLVAVRVYDAMT